MDFWPRMSRNQNWSLLILRFSEKYVTGRNRTFCKICFPFVIVIFRIVSSTRFGVSLYHGGKLFDKKCYSTSSRIFHITRESEDEQRPVLVSAHPPPKSAENYPSQKLEYLSPQTCYIASWGGI